VSPRRADCRLHDALAKLLHAKAAAAGKTATGLISVCFAGDHSVVALLRRAL
jgi:hypothetical protein